MLTFVAEMRKKNENGGAARARDHTAKAHFSLSGSKGTGLYLAHLVNRFGNQVNTLWFLRFLPFIAQISFASASIFC